MTLRLPTKKLTGLINSNISSDFPLKFVMETIILGLMNHLVNLPLRMLWFHTEEGVFTSKCMLIQQHCFLPELKHKAGPKAKQKHAHQRVFLVYKVARVWNGLWRFVAPADLCPLCRSDSNRSAGLALLFWAWLRGSRTKLDLSLMLSKTMSLIWLSSACRPQPWADSGPTKERSGHCWMFLSFWGLLVFNNYFLFIHYLNLT